VIGTFELTKVFGDHDPVVALDHVTFAIPRGQCVAVMGPSGSGKSTFLNLVGALDRPSSGLVRVNGHDLAAVRDIDRFRAREIGFVFQLHNLIPTLTARENVEVPMQGIGVRAAARRARAEELLALVGLKDRAGFLPGQLSGGERQRVAIARALANDPALILADEPTGSLDTATGNELIDRLVALSRERGKTVILVTHDPLVALRADRIVTLRDGRVDQDAMVSGTYLRQLDEVRDTALGRLLFGDAPVAPAGPGEPAEGGMP